MTVWQRLCILWNPSSEERGIHGWAKAGGRWDPHPCCWFGRKRRRWKETLPIVFSLLHPPACKWGLGHWNHRTGLSVRMGRWKWDGFWVFLVILAEVSPDCWEGYFYQRTSPAWKQCFNPLRAARGSALHADMDMTGLKLILVPHSTVKNPCSLRVKPYSVNCEATPAC